MAKKGGGGSSKKIFGLDKTLVIVAAIAVAGGVGYYAYKKKGGMAMRARAKQARRVMLARRAMLARSRGV